MSVMEKGQAALGNSEGAIVADGLAAERTTQIVDRVILDEIDLCYSAARVMDDAGRFNDMLVRASIAGNRPPLRTSRRTRDH